MPSQNEKSVIPPPEPLQLNAPSIKSARVIQLDKKRTQVEIVDERIHPENFRQRTVYRFDSAVKFQPVKVVKTWNDKINLVLKLEYQLVGEKTFFLKAGTIKYLRENARNSDTDWHQKFEYRIDKVSTDAGFAEEVFTKLNLAPGTEVRDNVAGRIYQTPAAP